MQARSKNHEVTFEIGEHFGVLSTSANGWTRELNMVSWNGCPEKYDLRDWDSQHKVMSRGITLTKDEIQALYDILKDTEPN